MKARARAITLLAALLGLASPWFGIPGWTLSVATVAAFTALALIGLNLVFGVLGMLAFGQAAFVALPGYVAGMLELLGAPTLSAMLAGVVVTVVVAAVVARIFVQLPGTYFAVGTLGFSFVIEGLARAFPEWTGGASGLVFASGRDIGPMAWYALATSALALGLLAWHFTVRTARDRRFRTVRHDELAAAVVGIDVARVKVGMFTLASGFCAVAGIGLAYYVGVLVPEGAGVNRSLEYVGTLLLGGAGSMLGPIVGAALVQWLFVVAGYGKQFELLLYGAAFLGAVLYARHGLVGLAAPLWRRAVSDRTGHGERADGFGRRAPELGDPALADARLQGLPAARGAAGGSGEALSVVDVSKNFGGVQALRSVSFSVRYGEIFALVGPNGAGKSTLFNVISGVEPPSAGQVLLDGERIDGLPIHRRAPRIGRAFQVARLVPGLSVLDNVVTRLDQIAPDMPEAARRGAALRQLRQFGLEGLAADDVAVLAAGQHKLIDLARAAVGSPRLVLLDEPAVGLTAAELDHLRRLLLELRDSGCAVVVVEHNIAFVSSVADRGVVLDGGALIAAGDFSSIIREPRVLEAYFGVLS